MVVVKDVPTHGVCRPAEELNMVLLSLSLVFLKNGVPQNIILRKIIKTSR